MANRKQTIGQTMFGKIMDRKLMSKQDDPK